MHVQKMLGNVNPNGRTILCIVASPPHLSSKEQIKSHLVIKYIPTNCVTYFKKSHNYCHAQVHIKFTLKPKPQMFILHAKLSKKKNEKIVCIKC
jgi:hypothetical protein